MRVAQYDAFEEAEFLHNFKAVGVRLEAESLDSLREADAILESQMEHYSAITKWIRAYYIQYKYECINTGIR